MIGRAITPEQKRAVIERIYRSWLAKPSLRLGQMLANSSRLGLSDDVFYAEDEPLADAVKKFAPPAPHDLTSSEVTLAKALDALIDWQPAEPAARTEIDALLFKLWDAVCGEWADEALAGSCATERGAVLLDRARKAGVL